MSIQRQRNVDDEETQCYAFFQNFLDEKHEREMAGILLYEDADACYSVVVNSLELFDSNIEVSQHLVCNPRKMLPMFHQALRECLRLLYEEHRLAENMKLKKNAFVRLSNLPTCPELTRNTIPRSSDIGRLLAFTGMFPKLYKLCYLAPLLLMCPLLNLFWIRNVLLRSISDDQCFAHPTPA